jgi:deazaflavin-dependent oxidoreductase (nitroreductase family)
MSDDTKPERDYSLFGDDHIAKYRETAGEIGHLWNGAPCLILTSRRKNGEIREVPLIYGVADGNPVIVASKGGTPDDPFWYMDLKRTPQAKVQILGEVFDVTAHTATADEKPALWAAMTEIWPDYDDYQSNTDRDIPVVVLQRS